MEQKLGLSSISSGCTRNKPQGLYITHGHSKAKTGAQRKACRAQKRQVTPSEPQKAPIVLALPGGSLTPESGLPL